MIINNKSNIWCLGVVHNTDPCLLTQWLKLIGDYISLLNSYQVKPLESISVFVTTLSKLIHVLTFN